MKKVNYHQEINQRPYRELLKKQAKKIFFLNLAIYADGAQMEALFD
ncbi:MAG: hypothetical protein LBE80_03250 [Deltaproteobacteria bacterium]|jgi:hypothetical protein|nr:hypothetical protein [Deltaproteobacteria bacterium]